MYTKITSDKGAQYGCAPILKRDFADNQIIIASIFRYDFDEVKTIEIVNRLIE